MKPGQRLWTREELILAINLYCKLPFGLLHSNNPEVIRLANLIQRTPGSVAFKLVNLASLDPSLKARGIKGASNASKLDAQIWDEFFGQLDILVYESEVLFSKLAQKPLLLPEELPEINEFMVGKEREQLVKTRVNQSFFRKTVLAAYEFTCCITGILQPELLIASHIRPWALDEKNRLNPQNGIAINALHDKAFEFGFLTITPEYKIKISPLLLNQKGEYALSYFGNYEGKSIHLPNKFLPDLDFLKYHNEERFKG